MPRVTTAIIGAGQSGLAMSSYLSARSVDHVLLERGQVANSWRTRRWDSFSLLTPNWLSRLPGYRYTGDNPDGFMSSNEITEYISSYGSAISAPIELGTEVTSVSYSNDEFEVVTDSGIWQAQCVVLASGAFGSQVVPSFANPIPPEITSVTSSEYRNPSQLPEGGVLVVGAAATGVQLAEEIHRSGRPVTLSVGEHVRLPRMYRGSDVMWWLDAAGVLNDSYLDVDDIVRARNVSSFQLVGSPERATLDLNALQKLGVRLVGRLGGVTDQGVAQFSGSLRNLCALADLKLGRLLDTLDEWALKSGFEGEAEPPHRFAATEVPSSPLLLSLRSGEIKTILWATGFKPEYPWLQVPVLDPKGQIRHDGGVTDLPGLYLIGVPFLRRRKSSFIDGADDDARDLSAHLFDYLDSLAAT